MPDRALIGCERYLYPAWLLSVLSHVGVFVMTAVKVSMFGVVCH